MLPLQFNDYPQSGVRTLKSEYALRAYKRLLEDLSIFVTDERFQAVFIRDIVKNDDSQGTPAPRPDVVKATTLEELMGTIQATDSDPDCRFIFLQTGSTRGRLCCSQEQLVYILAYHEVMPAFLDFCFQFTQREKPSTTNMLRIEDLLGPQPDQTQQQYSSLRIQHAFSVMAFDEREAHGYQWPLRAVVAYYSLDITRGKALWLIIKGDRAMRERIGQAQSLELSTECKENPLRAAMKTHLLILEWCTENWAEYIDDLEARSARDANAVITAPIDELVVIRETVAPPRPAPRPNSRVGTGLSQRSAASAQSLRTMTGLSRRASGMQQARAEQDAQLGKIFSYDVLQSLHEVSEDIDRAVLVVGQNKKIIQTLHERFTELSINKDLSGLFDRPDVCVELLGFLQQLKILESDLDGHESRLKSMQGSSQKTEEMFKDIIHYGMMRAGEQWTQSMHDVAVHTEKDTLAMHVITIFTLIFLPGTFFSTLFSSGIFSFSADNDDQDLGTWTVSRPALLLFVCLSVPATLVTVLIWGFIYFRAGYRDIRSKKQYRQTED